MSNDPLTVVYFSRVKSGCSTIGKLFFAGIFGGIALLTSGWVMWVTGIIGGLAALTALISLYHTVVRPAVLEMRPAGLVDLRAEGGPRQIPWSSIRRITPYRTTVNWMTTSASVTLHLQKPTGGIEEHKIDLDDVQYGSLEVAKMIQTWTNQFGQTEIIDAQAVSGNEPDADRHR